ncbi:hypothetical protein DPF85_05915 [Limosilactobacillus fermentum]|uniref:hypothetical protein n=1 Tax=Limosilactobacillus fermentum TaxID=1613 RepID=UPI000DBFFCFD|nr:hypothetical protein [Limosilactobacillus fermentum]RAM09876.1 hypothetical protein DPF85_05915 [Limosilactobacillus fermentum]
MTATINTRENGIYTINTKSAELAWQGMSEFGVDDCQTEQRLIEWQDAPDDQGVKHLLDWAVENGFIFSYDFD